MAINETQLAAATDYYWQFTDPMDIKFTENVLLYKLMTRMEKEGFDSYFVRASDTADGGRKVAIPLEYDNSHVGSYGQNTVIPMSKKDIANRALFRWGGIYAANALGLDDQVQNSGEEGVVHLAKLYTQNVLKSAWAELATKIIYRTSGDTIGPEALSDLFNTTTSTAYGNIAEDDMSTWKANVNSDGLAIGFEAMQTIFRTPARGQHKKHRPDLVVTTELLKDGYERSLFTQRQYIDDDLAAAGFDNIKHKGAPIVADDNYTAGELDALNTRRLHLKAHKDFNFTTPNWISLDQRGQPDVLAINTRWQGVFGCSDRAAHVHVTGMTGPV